VRHRPLRETGARGHRLHVALEDTVGALDELMSNAIRHGRAPVLVDFCVCDHGLLVTASDHAADEPPRPTSTRDPARGGRGLGIVAQTSLASGWCSTGDTKVVWAVMPAGRRT
jgi:anti-sigma regulatory factor (Ser/Thr protein kinase)